MTDSVKDIIPLLMVFCNTLSVFSKEQGYDKQFDGLNPEDAGLLLESNNGRINARIVKGDERPDMMCKTITGDAVFCRPYESDLRRKVFNELMKNRQEQE